MRRLPRTFLPGSIKETKTYQTNAHRIVAARKRAMRPRALTRGSALGDVSKDQYSGSYIPASKSIHKMNGRLPASKTTGSDSRVERRACKVRAAQGLSQHQGEVDEVKNKNRNKRDNHAD
jgi:hypothetical protein